MCCVEISGIGYVMPALTRFIVVLALTAACDKVDGSYTVVPPNGPSVGLLDR